MAAGALADVNDDHVPSAVEVPADVIRKIPCYAEAEVEADDTNHVRGRRGDHDDRGRRVPDYLATKTTEPGLVVDLGSRPGEDAQRGAAEPPGIAGPVPGRAPQKDYRAAPVGLVGEPLAVVALGRQLSVEVAAEAADTRSGSALTAPAEEQCGYRFPRQPHGRYRGLTFQECGHHLPAIARER